MMKHIFTGILGCFLLLSVSGQPFSFDTSSIWSATPSLHQSAGIFDSSSAVGVYDSRIIHFVIARDEIYMRTVYHRIVRINSDRGIEMFNKIYIPMYRESEVSGIRARTILPGGKVVDLPESKIKEIEEEGRRYKLFAMEGVEKGAEIEYTYTIRRPMNPFGIEVFQDKSVPYEQVRFALVAPAHLAFHVKGFNGFQVSSDSLIGDQRIVAGFDKNVPALEPEKYAVTDRYLRRVMYKMNYNLSSGAPEEMYTWKDFAKRALSAYTSLDEKEEKAMDKLAERIDVSAATSEAEKILLIEDHIKRNFNIDDKLFGADVEDLDRVLKTRNTNRDGAVRMFAAMFDRNRITYHLVFPSDRYSFPIEEDPENWNTVEQILFFFPKTGKFIDPEATSFRYPFIPPALAGGQGLFLKITTIGSYRTAIPVFNEVKMEPWEEHAMNMEAEVRFNDKLDTLYISSRQILKGWGASAYRPIYAFLPPDKQKEANIEIIRAVANSSDVSNIHVENTALTDYFSNKPLVIAGDIKSSSMIERAGDKILVKIGEIIGPQEEMYQEKPRHLPVELDFPHMLKRKITFRIPAGYQIKNAGDLNFDITHKQGQQVTMGFESSYTIEGNLLTVNISESYREMQYPLSAFEDFKKVINAAADFNKVVLVLEKE